MTQGYEHGGFWRISDRNGKRYRNWDTRREWNGSLVGVDEYEERHPQDFVRGLRDKQIVPSPRPPPVMETFIGPLQTDLTAAAVAGATTLNVTSSVRFSTGDTIALPLDNGNTLRTTISNVPTATTLSVPALPWAASIGNVVTNYSAVALADVG